MFHSMLSIHQGIRGDELPEMYDCDGMGTGTETAIDEHTVGDWTILQRANHKPFPLPDTKIQKQKKPHSDLLEFFREEIRVPRINFSTRNLESH